MKTPVAFTRKSPVAVRIPAFVTVPESMLIFFANISFSAPFVKLADFMFTSPLVESIFPSFVKIPVAFTSTPTARIFPAFVKSLCVAIVSLSSLVIFKILERFIFPLKL